LGCFLGGQDGTKVCKAVGLVCKYGNLKENSRNILKILKNSKLLKKSLKPCRF